MVEQNKNLIITDARSVPSKALIDAKTIKEKIYNIRNQKVMLDVDLAEIYGYSTRAFNQQVKNNIEKFDNDFMFQLNKSELEYLQSNFLTANISSKSRSLPYAFTEQGVYMLMTVQNFDYYADIVIECYWGSIRKNKRYLSIVGKE
ncbi:hypothetical protein CG392_04915 [Gardnerella vaginalis]|nr:hypothetical protein CG392_04915 [Gardnerella vaginalis]